MHDRHALILIDRYPSAAQAAPEPRDRDARRASRRRLRLRIAGALFAAAARLSPSIDAARPGAVGIPQGALAARPRPPG